MSALYLVGLPIGNLSEINHRALEILNQLEIIYCENTDNFKKLLNLLNIDFRDKKLISYHKFNETNRFSMIQEQLKSNDVGLVSDAGFPCINDPGQKLVSYLRSIDFNQIICINGSNAALCALATSGFESSQFYYGGFLVTRNKKSLTSSMKNWSTTPRWFIMNQFIELKIL